MDFTKTERQEHFQHRVREFMDTEVRPAAARYRRELAEGDRWTPLPVLEELKGKARDAGLWN